MPEYVDMEGFDEANEALASLPDLLREAISDSAGEGTSILLNALESQTPVRSGRLIRGWRTSVSTSGDEATGKVFNETPYGPYVEAGRHPHHRMRSNPFTKRGISLASGTVLSLAEANVQAVVDTLNRE